MQNPRYALVAYVRNSVGEFVERLRRDLHPDLPHFPAHITILPPRRLCGNEIAALEMLEDVCHQVAPFEVGLGDMETFVPVTPTVFIRVTHGTRHLRQLHDQLNTDVLLATEEWPYMPHLTIVKISSAQLAREGLILARDRWAQFKGSRRIPIHELTFVREEEQNCWTDLAGLPLGRSLVKH